MIVPSLPGYGFSTPLRMPGVNWWKTADLWVELMEELGHRRFASAGGDWGSFITAQLGHKHADRMIGVYWRVRRRHSTLMRGVGFDAADYSAEEAPLVKKMAAFRASETGYLGAPNIIKPQTPAVALNDSPAGLLAGIVEEARTLERL